jgi:hypothetical protein
MTRLRSRYVTVHLAGLGGLPAVVEAEDDGGVRLSLALSAPDGLDRALERPVRIECVTPRGIQNLTGSACRVTARPDELRVTRDEDELIQRRDSARVEALVPALLIVGDGVRARVSTTTVNVSTLGLLVCDPLDLPIGTVVRVEVELEAGGPPLVVAGRLVREADPGEKGLHFGEITREGQQRLARFIAERQRAEMRMAAGR